MPSSLEYENETTKTLKPYREFIDDLVEGSIGIKKRKGKYLPKEKNEKQESFDSRLAKATYFDAFNPTIDSLVGLVFSNPIEYSEDIPQQLQATIENADMQGNHFDILIEEFFTKAMQKGISFCLVDMPKGRPTNKQDELRMGIRPYLTIVKAEDITSWKTEIIAGQMVLSQVKIREFLEVDDPDNEYATKLVKRYRVLTRGKYEVYEEKDKKSHLIESGTTGLNFIPLVALNLNSRGFFDALPPFYDLGEMNIGHYQVFADNRHSAHTASVPFYFGAGMHKEEAEGLIISPNTFFATSNSEASIEIVDYKGDGVEVNNSILDRYETRMREMGLAVITQDGETTATEVKISSKQSQSKLNSYVRALVDSVELILLYCAKMYGKDNGGSISIDADILSNPLTNEELTTINNMVTSGNMSLDTMYKIIANGTFRLPADFDVEDEKEKINADGLVSLGEDGTVQQPNS